MVQLGCLFYEAVLVQRCNMLHMRLFSVFLVLPSATVRLMVQQPLKVDEDVAAAADDDDDLELSDVAAAAAAGEAFGADANIA